MHHLAFLPGIAKGNVQTGKTVKQGAPGDPQLPRGAGAIAMVLVQAVEQERTLHSLHPLAQRHVIGSGRLWCRRQCQVLGPNHAVVTQQHGAFHQAFELAYVAGKTMAGQLIEGGIRPFDRWPPQRRAHLACEMARQLQHIAVPLAQGR